MKHFIRSDIEHERAVSERGYLEFLRVPSLSAGLYVLPAGTNDLQAPHSEDEIYVIQSGRATFRGGGEEVLVGPGSVLYVSANEEHRFHSITEELSVLVIFAPAESTAARR